MFKVRAPIHSPLVHQWLYTVYKPAAPLRYSLASTMNKHRKIIADLPNEALTIENGIKQAAALYNKIDNVYTRGQNFAETAMWIQFVHGQKPYEPFYKQVSDLFNMYPPNKDEGFENYQHRLQRKLSLHIVFRFLLEPHLQLFYNQKLQALANNNSDLNIIRQEFKKALTTDFLTLTKRFHEPYRLLNFGDHYSQWLIRNYKINLVLC